MLRTAREAIAAKLQGKIYTPDGGEDSALARPAGAFVTLHRNSALRGCIGTFESSQPLIRTVAEMAVSAAFKDPRFRPLESFELDEVELEISVLSPMRAIDNPQELTVGVHGLYVVRGVHRGVLLPQVATEHGWDRRTFLEETCRKAGLPRDAWQGGVTLYVFEAEVFGERDQR